MSEATTALVVAVIALLTFICSAALTLGLHPSGSGNDYMQRCALNP